MPDQRSILIVDDEPLIRAFLDEVFQEAGWSVTSASSGDEAVAQLDGFDALLTDIEMPGKVNGVALAWRVFEHSPRVGIVVTSGRVHPQQGSLPPMARFISKPAPHDVLIELVTEAVRRASGEADVTTGERQHLRLANFIRQNGPAIQHEWIEFARTREPASSSMTRLALQDHIALILKFIADDLDTPQTATEQFDKSRGYAPFVQPGTQSVAEVHAALRLADGFDIDQMVSEYRALRASITKLWTAHNSTLEGTDIEDLIRFNEAIDESLTASVAHYTKTINDSRNLFLGVLGHDLRNPISAASGGGRMMLRPNVDDAKRIKVATEIVRTTDRATQILNDLLDLSRTSFGTDIRVVKAPMDIATLCSELADELRAVNGSIEVDHTGDTTGSWDRSRMGQAISNVMANAFQHGDASGPVTVKVDGQNAERVTVSVHNHGQPIAADKIKLIFNSWTSGRIAGGTSEQAGTHLGLGLYIAKLMVDAHGGKIAVVSDNVQGTAFTLELPRA